MSERNGIPDLWTWADLSEVCTKITDGTHHSPPQTSQTATGDYLYVTAKNIKEWGVDLSKVTYIPQELHRPIYERCNPQQGDVLYIKDGVTTGIATVNQLDEEISLLSSVALLKPNKNIIDARFLKWFLNSPIGYHSMTSKMGGTAIKRLTVKKIKEGRALIAPLNEQRRIVEKLEELFSDLDAGVAALKRARANLKRYRAAVLKAAVEGKLTAEWREQHPDVEPASELLAHILRERRRRWEQQQLETYEAKGKKLPKNWKDKYKEPAMPDTDGLPELPDGWCWATAEQLTDETRAITYGVVKLGKPTENGIPTLRSSNVRPLRVDLGYVKPISTVIADNYKRTLLEGGELLVTVRGTLGGICLVPDTCRGFNISREVAMLALIEQKCGPTLALFIASRPIQNWIMRNTRGIAYTGINIQTLKEMPVPLPPMQEQRQITEIVEERLSAVEQMEALIQANNKRADRLRQSILKQAFEGKLVQQDPADEPARVLLDRIQRNSRKDQSKSTHRRRVDRSNRTNVTG